MINNQKKIELLHSITHNINEINRYTALLLEDSKRVCIMKHHVQLSEVENAELGFLKLISFLYVSICDGGNTVSKKNLTFILDFDLNPVIKLKKLIAHINSFRTYFQHFVINEVTEVKKWFLETIYCDYPINNTDHWSICFEKLINETNIALEDLLNFLNHKHSQNEFNDIFIEKWKNKTKDTGHSATEYHDVFRKIKGIYGFDFIAGDFCNPNITKWDKKIEKLISGYDFEKEASKLIAEEIFENIKTGKLPVPYTSEELNSKYGTENQKLNTAYYKHAKDLCIKSDYRLTLPKFWEEMDGFHAEFKD